MSVAEPAQKQRVLALLVQHGWNSTSFQILEPGFQYWFDGDDACVGYVDTGTAWVAAGPPIASAERIASVAEKFSAAAHEQDRRVCCFGTELRFSELAKWPSVRIGEQPLWHPAEWESTLKQSKSLREQLRRARAKGVVVEEIAAAQLAPGQPLREELESLVRMWQRSQALAPMGFLVKVELFEFAEERHYFIARRAGEIVAFLGVIPIYARRGWFFEDFIRGPAAPNGTVELLIDAGMRAAKSAGIELVTLGLAPLAGDVSPWLRFARRWGRLLYDFDGLRAFKAKLKPQSWDPIFLSYPAEASPVLATKDTLTAFSRGGLLRFGIETMLRGPTVVVQALALLLAVWTVLIALPISTRWFPSSAWQWGWVAFDIAVFVALFALSRRWRHTLATLVAAAITADAVITLGEALVYNVPHRQSLWDALVIAVAIAAPTFASVVLWNARARAATGAARA
jgi:phosphatidylglycerol lysyltransferase